MPNPRSSIYLILFFAFLLGMAPLKKQSPTQTSINKFVIKQTLLNLKSAYESRNPLAIIDLLDKDFEALLEFRANLEKHFLSVKNLEIIFILDSFLTDQDKVSVRLHWLKKTTDNAGTFSKSKGSSQFLFKKTTQGLKLLHIRGDNPFF